MIDMGLSIEDIALMIGTVGFAAGLVGAILGGWWVKYLGRYRALIVFCVIQAITCGAWIILPLGFDAMWLLYTLSIVEHFSGGLATAALFTVMMDHCRPLCAGSDYTIQSCIVVMMNMVAAGMSGIVAVNIGYTNHFALAGIAGLISIPFIYRYRKQFIS